MGSEILGQMIVGQLVDGVIVLPEWVVKCKSTSVWTEIPATTLSTKPCSE